MARVIKDAVDLRTGDKVYFTGHASATFLNDGSTVEEALNNKVNTSTYEDGINTINASLSNIDASNIKSGVLSIDRIPRAALERLYVFANESAALAAVVDNGDVIKLENTGAMYYCVSQTGTFAERFTAFSAGSAASVPWTGITGMPDLATQDELNVVSAAIPTNTSELPEGSNLYFTNDRAVSAVTGAATTVVASNLTANRALISNANGKIAVSSVSKSDLEAMPGEIDDLQDRMSVVEDGKLDKDALAEAAKTLKTSSSATAYTVGQNEGIGFYNPYATKRFWFGHSNPSGSQYQTTNWMFGSSDGSNSSDNSNIYGGYFRGKDFITTSDERLKDFTSDVQVDFEALKYIPKKYYYWKDKSMGEDIQIGTSAQKLSEIYPTCVFYDEISDRYSVNYQKLSIVALAAIDKLYDKILELESKINHK